MDSVQNDISVLFDATKVQASTQAKQTKNQVFESILNSLQTSTKKSLSLDKSSVKNEPIQKKSFESKSKDFDKVDRLSVKEKPYKAKPQERKSTQNIDKKDSIQERQASNKIDENQPTSQSSRPSSQEPASLSEDGDTNNEESLNEKKSVESNQHINDDAHQKVEEDSSDELLNKEDSLEASLVAADTLAPDKINELPVDETVSADETVSVEDVVDGEVNEEALVLASVESADSTEDIDLGEVTVVSNDSTNVDIEQGDELSAEGSPKNEVSDFEIKALLKDIESLQSSPELRELAQRVLDTTADYSDQDLKTLGVEDPERFKEIVRVLSAFTETPNQVDAYVLENPEVKRVLESIDSIVQNANDLTTGEIDISDFESVDPKVLDTDLEDVKLFDDELVEAIEIESIEVEEAPKDTKELRSTEEIKKDLKMIREDNVKGDQLKEQKVKEVVKEQDQKAVVTEKNESKDSDLVKKSQSLIRTVGKVQVEQEASSQELSKLEPAASLDESSLNQENSDSDSNEEQDSLLNLTKNLSKGQKTTKKDETLSRFDQLLNKANIVSEKVVSKEVGLSVDGSKKVLLTKVVRHPGFQSSTKIVVKQIQDLTKLLNPPKVNRLTMALKPERLGEVRLEIKHINDGIKLSFEVENHAVKEIIEKNISQLKDSLKLQNIDASDVEVNVKDDRGESDSAKEEKSSKKQKNKKSFDMDQELQDSEENSIEQDYQINQYA